MSLAKRLTRIETSLTPKQAVLLWLKEVQQLDINTFVEKLCTCPRHEEPRVRVPEMAARAVRESLNKKAITPESAQQAELEARRQADFLVVLVMRLQTKVLADCAQKFFCIRLLDEMLYRILDQFLALKVFDAAEWDVWRMLLVDTLACMWRLRDTIAAISKNYYDGQSLLLPEAENRLNQRIQDAELLANFYNKLEGILPSWTAIELATLQSSIEAQVPAAVAGQVACANAEVLQALGQGRAAWDRVEPYAVAAVEKCRSGVPAAGLPRACFKYWRP